MTLTPADIRAIRHYLIDADMTMKRLALAVGISYSTLAYIMRREYGGPAANRVLEYVKQRRAA